MSDFDKMLTEVKGYGKRADAALAEAESVKPEGRPAVKRVILKCDKPEGKLPSALQRDYSGARDWLSGLRDGPMAKVTAALTPYSGGANTGITNYDFRWVGHYTFPLKMFGRIFGYQYTVEWAAAVYVGMWTASRFDITDNNLLERTISAGVVAADTLWFADNLHSPIVAKAYKLNLKWLELHKARMTRETAVNHPGKPWWWRQHPMYHPTAEWLMFLWALWLLTGDEEAFAGYLHIAAQVREGFDYAKTKDGTEIVLIPHFVRERNNDVFRAGSEYPMGAQDATYSETFLEAVISLYWAGADVFDFRFLAAYANTMHLVMAPNGFDSKDKMAEAICGSTPEGEPAKNKRTEVFLITGEVVKVKTTESNRTNTRQHAICLRRATTFGNTSWATKANPKLAKVYHANLDKVEKGDTRLGAAQAWKVASMAQEHGYKVTEAY